MYPKEKNVFAGSFIDTDIPDPRNIFESKFTVPSHMRHIVLSLLRHRAEVPNEFPIAKVKTVYFDDMQDTNYYDSLDGFLDKRKYRLREYLDSEEGARYSLEVKLRDDSKTSKLRKLIFKALPADYEFTTFRDLFEVFERVNGFSLNKLRMGLPQSELYVDTTIYYERYRFDDVREDARYNLDTRIMLHSSVKAERDFREGVFLNHDIFEIKSASPMQLPSFLKGLSIEPAAFSKFVWGKELCL